MVQLLTPGVTPNRRMGSPWGAFCQITLTSCFSVWKTATDLKPILHYTNFIKTSQWQIEDVSRGSFREVRVMELGLKHGGHLQTNSRGTVMRISIANTTAETILMTSVRRGWISTRFDSDTFCEHGGSMYFAVDSSDFSILHCDRFPAFILGQ